MNTENSRESEAAASFVRLSPEDKTLLIEAGYPGIETVLNHEDSAERVKAAVQLYDWYVHAEPTSLP